MAEVIIDNDYYTLVYYPKTRILHHTFHQTTRGQVLHDGLDAGIDAMRRLGAVKWLSDDRKNGGVTPDDIKWSINDWGPRAAAAGWKYWALVVPEDFAAKVDMNPVVNGFYQLGVRVMVFIDLAAAREWLEVL